MVNSANRKKFKRRGHKSIVLRSLIGLIIFLFIILIFITGEEDLYELAFWLALVMLAVFNAGSLIRMKKAYELTEDGIRVHSRVGILMNLVYEIKWDNIKQISAKFPSDSKGLLQKDFSLFKKKKSVTSLPAIKIEGTILVRGRQLIQKIKSEREFFTLYEEFSHINPRMAKALVKRASELTGSEESQKFAEKFPPLYNEYLEHYRKIGKTRRFVPGFSAKKRAAFRYKIPLLIALAGIPLLLYHDVLNVYHLLLASFIYLLTLWIISVKWYFRRLPLMPSSYAGIEGWRLGCLLLFLLFPFYPKTIPVLLFLFLCLFGFSFTMTMKDRGRRFFAQVVTGGISLLIIVLFVLNTLSSPGIKIDYIGWKGNSIAKTIHVSPGGENIASYSMEINMAKKEYESEKLNRIFDRLRSVGQFFHFFNSTISDKEKTKEYFRKSISLVELDDGQATMKTWKGDAVRDCRTFVLIPGVEEDYIIGAPYEPFKTEGNENPKEPLYLFSDEEPEPIDWSPEFTTTCLEIIIPKSSFHGQLNRFGVYCRDQESVYVTTFDAETIKPIVTHEYERLEKDDHRKARYIWHDKEFVRKVIDFKPSPDSHLDRILTSYSPGGDLLLYVIREGADKCILRIWNTETGEKILERNFESSDKDEFSCWWTPGSSRFALFHDYELLLYDFDQNEWKRIFVANMNRSILAITGAWSPNGENFYYYQPCIFTGLFGGEIYRALWEKTKPVSEEID